jgi:hypothetical protein
METFRQDLRFALRSLRNARATTLIAVLCLALGIGANTAIFSVVRAVLLQSLPYGEPERLVRINETGSRGIASVSGPVYFDMKAQRQIFEDVAAFAIVSADLGDAGEPERLRGVRGTVSLFTTLGVKPMIGRGFLASDEPPSGSPVVVISEGLWQRRFAADRRLVGTQITLNNNRYTVIGVMPRAFDFPMSTTRKEFWIPLAWVESQTETIARSKSWLASLPDWIPRRPRLASRSSRGNCPRHTRKRTRIEDSSCAASTELSSAEYGWRSSCCSGQ